MNISKDKAKKGSIGPGKNRSYNEVIAYLNDNWKKNEKSATLKKMKKLDQAFGSVAKKIDAVLVAGTNGKSITVHFATKLLQGEGLKTGTFLSPHIMTYNERISVNQKPIPNKTFAEIADKVIETAESLSLEIGSYEILLMTALLYFETEKIDVAIMEVNEGGHHNAVNICNVKVAAVTRATAHDTIVTDRELDEITGNMASMVKPGSFFVSGDQNKARLLMMQKITEERGGNWLMPIRKLAPIPYPCTQLHGRCAAIAERIAYVYINNFATTDSIIVKSSLLIKQKGKRGRPTMEAKRQAELNPRKTTDQFWRENNNTLSGRFQLLDKEKPTTLLDNADNLDAFENLFLGIRLIHYKRPIKGLTIILGAAKNQMDNGEFLKLVRYFLKKTPGQLFLCPLDKPVPGAQEDNSWDVEQFTNDCKSMKIKARAFHSFDKAFDVAKTTVDDRHGLLVVAGSQSVINAYWTCKGIKKLG